MKYFFFDTETTGLPKDIKDRYTNLDDWPFVLQMGMILYEDNELIQEAKINISPSDTDFDIAEKAFATNGLTNEYLRAHGSPIGDAIELFLKFFNEADVVIAHNAVFDLKVLKAELIRHNIDLHLRSKAWIDTMYYCTKLTGRRYTSLSKLYKFLFNKEFKNQHDALGDTLALKDSFFEMRNQGVLLDDHIKAKIADNQKRLEARGDHIK